MVVFLPLNKHPNLEHTTCDMITKKKEETCFSNLGTTIGRLGYVGVTVCPIFHSLRRIRELKERAMNSRSIKINEKCLKDLLLMLSFLDLVRDQIDLNQLAYRKPIYLYCSDSCPASIGGYSHKGYAWRIYIPEYLQKRSIKRPTGTHPLHCHSQD